MIIITKLVYIKYTEKNNTIKTFQTRSSLTIDSLHEKDWYHISEINEQGVMDLVFELVSTGYYNLKGSNN